MKYPKMHCKYNNKTLALDFLELLHKMKAKMGQTQHLQNTNLRQY